MKEISYLRRRAANRQNAARLVPVRNKALLFYMKVKVSSLDFPSHPSASPTPSPQGEGESGKLLFENNAILRRAVRRGGGLPRPKKPPRCAREGQGPPLQSVGTNVRNFHNIYFDVKVVVPPFFSSENNIPNAFFANQDPKHRLTRAHMVFGAKSDKTLSKWISTFSIPKMPPRKLRRIGRASGVVRWQGGVPQESFVASKVRQRGQRAAPLGLTACGVLSRDVTLLYKTILQTHQKAFPFLIHFTEFPENGLTSTHKSGILNIETFLIQLKKFSFTKYPERAKRKGRIL